MAQYDLKLLEEKGIGFISYGTLAKSMLSGKLTKESVFEPWDYRTVFREKYMSQFEQLEPKINELYAHAKQKK